MVQFNSLDKVTFVIWLVISHITSKHAMKKNYQQITDQYFDVVMV